ncbi:MAG TPA: hypothetical protein VM580_35410, partial [Labilithrix sp.]|nr:hypothetical protein [Labilithrix sp.]
THEYGSGAGTDYAYGNSFVASPFERPYRPRRKTPRPRVGGTLVATVTGPSGQEIHTDKLGRMTALYAFDRLGKDDETSSQWIRSLQPNLGGSMTLPRVGWEMAMVHLDGRPEHAVAVARMYDGEHLPPEKLPEGRTKTSFESLSSPRGEKINAITMDDATGAMMLALQAAKTLEATVVNDETEKIGASDSLIVGKDSNVDVGGTQSVTVEKDEVVEAEKDASLTVKGNRKKVVGDSQEGGAEKDETVTIGGGLTVRVDGNDAEEVRESLTQNVSEKLSETTKGSYEVYVDGAVTSKASQDVTLYVAGTSSEEVVSDKIVTSSDGALSTRTDGDMKLSVGGNWVETADGNYASSAASGLSRNVAAGSQLNATRKLQVKAATITIRLKTSATFDGAGRTITVSVGSIGLDGKVTVKGKNGVDLVGSPQLLG